MFITPHVIPAQLENTMRTIIAGSRSIKDYDLVVSHIIASKFDISLVLCGGASGVDRLGDRYARVSRIPRKYYFTKWRDISTKNAIIKKDKFGNYYNARAGFDRNQLMADNADALIAISLNHSSGTEDMIRRAIRNNLKIHIVRL